MKTLFSTFDFSKNDLPPEVRVAHILVVKSGDVIRVDTFGDIEYFNIDEDGYFACYQEEGEDCILTVHGNQFFVTVE